MNNPLTNFLRRTIVSQSLFSLNSVPVNFRIKPPEIKLNVVFQVVKNITTIGKKFILHNKYYLNTKNIQSTPINNINNLLIKNRKHSNCSTRIDCLWGKIMPSRPPQKCILFTKIFPNK